MTEMYMQCKVNGTDKSIGCMMKIDAVMFRTPQHSPMSTLN